MSLQVWLPLNGNINNYGLSNVTYVSGTPSYKRGKLSTNALNLNNRITFDCAALANLQTFSVCFWGMAESSSTLTSNWQDLLGFTDTSSGGTNGTFRWETSYSSTNGIHWHDNATNAIVNGAHNHTTVKDIWVHCCVVFDKEKGQLYSYDNGILTQTHTHAGGKFNSTGRFYLGETNNIEGRICDVRFYNHALSAKEVKEIAKGLVLHYKLDNNGLGNPNLAINSNTNSTLTNVWNLSMQNGDKAITIEQDDGINCVKITRGSTTQSGWAFLSYNNFDRQAIKADTWYTASFDIKSSVAGTINFTGLVNGNATNYMTGSNRIIINNQTVANQWSHIIISIKTISDFSSITIGSQVIYFSPSASLLGTGVTLLLKNIKLEEGTIASPWIPNVNDALYSAMNGNTIYDVSGYNHAATANAITWSGPSPRYSTAASFNGSSSYIKVDDNSWMAQGSIALTVNIWAYMSDWTSWNGHRLYSCTEGGGFNIENTIAKSLTFPVCVYTNEGQTSTAYIDTNLRAAILKTDIASGWHMFTYVYETTGCSCYLDGTLYQTKPYTSYGVYYNINGSRLFLGCEANGVNPSGPYFNGQESDFRIYATALSADDIKELYNTSATIDRDGNIYGREFNTISSNFQITKTGIVTAVDKITEHDNKTAYIEKNKDIVGGQFYEY